MSVADLTAFRSDGDLGEARDPEWRRDCSELAKLGTERSFEGERW